MNVLSSGREGREGGRYRDAETEEGRRRREGGRDWRINIYRYNIRKERERERERERGGERERKIKG